MIMEDAHKLDNFYPNIIESLHSSEVNKLEFEITRAYEIQDIFIGEIHETEKNK